METALKTRLTSRIKLASQDWDAMGNPKLVFRTTPRGRVAVTEFAVEGHESFKVTFESLPQAEYYMDNESGRERLRLAHKVNFDQFYSDAIEALRQHFGIIDLDYPQERRA